MQSVPESVYVSVVLWQKQQPSLVKDVISRPVWPVEVCYRCVDDKEADAADPVHMYYVNDGVYGSFNCILYDHVTVEASLLDVSIKYCAFVLITVFYYTCIAGFFISPYFAYGHWLRCIFLRQVSDQFFLQHIIIHI